MIGVLYQCMAKSPANTLHAITYTIADSGLIREIRGALISEASIPLRTRNGQMTNDR